MIFLSQVMLFQSHKKLLNFQLPALSEFCWNKTQVLKYYLAGT